jgi:glutathione S-transferase
MKIELFSFPPLPDLPNLSPFCMKLETYLRMSGVDFSTQLVKSGSRSPTGKIPYIRLDGEIIADSGLVIRELETRLPNPVDAELTPQQRGESVAIQRMLEEHLYWVVVYSRWEDDQAWPAFRDMVSGSFGAPAFALSLFRPLLRRRVRGYMNGHGIGRHAPETIWALGAEDTDALAGWLGNREWAFGTRPHVLDACISAFTASVVRMPWEYPLKDAFMRHPNLTAHLERMLNAFYPD